jgi:hypothetical protein
MNSILQQMYMLPEFRDAISGINEDTSKDPEENLLYQL